MLLDVAADGVLEVGDGLEDAAPDAPAGDDGEEAFDGVKPRGRGGGEMEDPARMVGQPFSDLGVLVGGVIVRNGVDDLAGRNRPLHSVEKFDEFLVGVLGHAAANHRAVEDVEGSEQGGGAVALVVMGQGGAFPRLQRQAGLGAVKGLDLAFFVDRNNDGMGGWVHIEPDDILDFGGEGGIVGLLEGAEAVRLKTVSRPEPLYGAQADANGLGHHAAGPMGGFTRRFGAGQGENLGDDLQRQGRFAGLARLVAQQTVHPLLGEALLPAPHRRAAGFGLAGDIDNRQSIRRKKNDPSPEGMLLRAVAITEDGGQTRAVFGSKDDADGLCHAFRIAWINPVVNPLFSSVH